MAQQKQIIAVAELPNFECGANANTCTVRQCTLPKGDG